MSGEGKNVVGDDSNGPASDARNRLEHAIAKFDAEGVFSVFSLTLDEDLIPDLARFRVDPVRFLPSIFDGNWAHPECNPEAGEIRFVRVVRGNDGVSRIIGRQGKWLFAYPWIR